MRPATPLLAGSLTALSIAGTTREAASPRRTGRIMTDAMSNGATPRACSGQIGQGGRLR
ncbi:MAG: hypothetical protein J0H38_00370 [Rhizobiales bacterium]|nr:hypothetical protein [Hyphomicrobiales bacterium]